MATELRWALIVISALIIGGLLIHGLWSVRKKEDKEDRRQNLPAANEHSKPSEPELNDMSFTAVEEEQHSHSVDASDIQADSQPSLQEEQAQTDQSAGPAVEPQDFIILHIQMPEGLAMEGSKLLPSVLSLGFKFSEEGFFNRHLESSGNGPVLFRLVNMYNPGTFDIDNMEQFSTAGVSLFMTLPCEGDSMAAFNMLHGAAKKLSDEFGAQVLDSKREPLTVDTIRTYVEKVREFAA
ncbi:MULTISPECIES: cell division protein ZipA [Pseudoalteromonas]|uniref:Cell division protein ZipA n=1 Tax=Pseudoalteromonas obscura TaxID=3048491 RepID=A0ABT7EII9_9GAMM|nr:MULTISPECIES: cell division protein ZipA [Pseudoalteromonas]MBQ4838474.1 cell division protein ZipA [Pseudoalteromonas luteoviolacea]MDK2594833.1 cell division protein ZipA [Pseudoalteromonas sp. P94(2023)]